MKTKTKLLLPLALFYIVVAFAQRTETTGQPVSYYSSVMWQINLDFQTRNVLFLPKKIKEGDFYQIKFSNINPNRYNIVINSKDTLLMKALETPTFKDISLDAITALTSSFAETAQVSAELIDLTTPLDNIPFALVKMKTFNIKSPNNTASDAQIIAEIDKYKTEMANFTKILNKSKENYDQLKFELYSYRLNELKKKVTPHAYNYDAALQKFSQLRDDLARQEKDLAASKKAYEAYLEKPEVVTFLGVAGNAAHKKSVAEISEAYTTIQSKIDEFQEVVSADNVEKLLKSILFLDSNGNSFTSLPMQFTKDLTEVSIKFLARDSSIAVQGEEMRFSFPLTRSAYWSIGTSFYYSNLKQERFSTNTRMSGETALYQIIREEDLQKEAGMAVTLRAGQKLESVNWLGYHCSFGPGVSIAKEVRPRILFGGGLSFGRKHNLTIDWGGIFGYVDRKASAVNLNVEGTIKPENITITEIQVANYFSIGYMYKL